MIITMDNRLKILIVRLSAIGDVIHSIPILHSLRQKFPDAYISWAVEDRASAILVNNPLLDKLYVFPKQKWKKRGFCLDNFTEFFEIINEIKSEKFDIAIDLQELFKSGLVTGLSGAKRKIAHAGTREFADIFITEKLPAHDIFDPNKLIIERYLEPAAYLGAPTDEVKFSLPPIDEEIKTYIDTLLEKTDKNKPNIIFSPATIWDSKHWLEEYWAELLDKLSEEYNVIFTGVEKDKLLIDRIVSKAKIDNYFTVAGKTSLFELIELFNRSKYVIAPDTGPVHIANASGVPVIIAIFGSTSYKRTPPYGDKHFALSEELPCQPCFKRNCPRVDIPMECMKKITPDNILKIIKS